MNTTARQIVKSRMSKIIQDDPQTAAQRAEAKAWEKRFFSESWDGPLILKFTTIIEARRIVATYSYTIEGRSHKGTRYFELSDTAGVENLFSECVAKCDVIFY